ncbi:MAG TPA: hypothetical protein VFG99_09790, partial [Chloroflexia bacterium]|nr:hypothetical protein [Chloroflexia bacterium]
MAQRRSSRYDAAKEARALNFATALADALHELHITHKDLAHQLGVSIFSVDYWTRGVNPSTPGAENLNRLCALLEARSPGAGVAVARAAGYSWQPDATASPIGSQPDQHGPETAPERERATPTNLPHQISSFIGREREIGEVRELLSRVRLLTLTGAGGIGKTRLAIEVAAACTNLFPDGVWLVELAPLSDPAALPQAVAYALDVRDEPGQSTTDKLTVHIGKKRMLLVLDNCEHLVEDSARITMRLLQTCPGLTVLATSREALRLDGETLWRVPPLGVPDISQQAAPANLLGHAAIRLFVERATSSSSAFGMTEQNAASVARICAQLDGIPLAIELAAACVSFLTLEQIEARLSDQFRLLTTGSRMVLPRHRTLHAAIEWSYKLLSVEEQALFRRLSVFAGGWSLEGAEAICTGARVDLLHVAPMLKALVDKSLVLAETKGYAARYSMLQTIREYAALRLEEEEDAGVLRTRHAAYYADLAERAEPELLGQHQTEW